MTAKPALKRRIGTGLLTLYGIGVMVGAGVYVLIGAVAGEAGHLAPLAFLIAGLIAAPTAISYAELSGRIPESAGEAAYLQAATGSSLAAIGIGLAVAVVGVVSAGAVLQGGVGYLTQLVPLPPAVLILGLAALLTVAAIVGVLESLMLAAILTITEVIGLLIVIGAGFAVEPVEIQPSGAGLGGLAAAAFLAFFAFIGFEDMVNMAEETRDPGRAMPRAILGAVAVTTLIYILVAWASLRAVPAGELAESARPLALVFERASGQGSGFLALIAVAAAMNGVLAQVVMSARVLFGLGRRSSVFAIFHRAHPRFGTPVLATVLAAAAATLLALFAPLVDLADITATVLLAVFVVVNVALILLRRTRDEADGSFRAPGFVPWLGALLSLMALIWRLA